MSTRAAVSVLCKDEKVRSIYVHFDGNGLLLTLKRYYNNKELAEQLVMLGDASYIDELLEPPDNEEHSFERPCKRVSVFYGRDRGEDDTEPRVYNSFEEAKRKEHQEYNFFFDGVTWKK
jgi:hypothetical protein